MAALNKKKRKDDRALQARAAFEALSKLPLRKASLPLVIRPEEGGKAVAVTVPREAFDLLMGALEQMADGNPVAIATHHPELTTQEAADLLGVSRPFLVNLLDAGAIPCRLVGKHRRVRRSDLMTYKNRDDRRRVRVLEELTSEAEKHGLGY